ncbi:MAG: hypothetical protein LQ350_006955 [Teloschistes chrysophthalmus]|nr:MAG: hypothetical protein LQ350_006955 [Niorma chrysophthalma]
MDELKGRTPISTSDPSPAYRTFFKDTHNLSYIRKLLMRVARGEPVYSPTFPPHAWQKISPQGNPVILVISERRQLGGATNDTMQDMYDWCAEYSMSTGVIMKNPATPNPLVVLCPYFFEAKPPYVKGDSAIAPVNGKPTKDCLSVNTRTNEFLKVTPPDQHAGYELASYRQWILLHLLASLYRYSDSKDMSNEAMDVNSAWRMNAGEALNNGHNYMWYAAKTSNSDNTSNVGPVNNANLAETINVTDIEIPVGTPLKIALD